MKDINKIWVERGNIPFEEMNMDEAQQAFDENNSRHPLPKGPGEMTAEERDEERVLLKFSISLSLRICELEFEKAHPDLWYAMKERNITIQDVENIIQNKRSPYEYDEGYVPQEEVAEYMYNVLGDEEKKQANS